MAGLKLYEITHQMSECIDTETGEVNIERLGALTLQFNDKAIACAAVSKNLRAESDAVESEIRWLTQRKAAIDNNRRRLLDYLLGEMQRAGVDKVTNGIHQIRRAKSPLSVQVPIQRNRDSRFSKLRYIGAREPEPR